MEIVTRWFGVFAFDKGRIVEGRVFPPDLAEIRKRWEERLGGSLTQEERELWEKLKNDGHTLLQSRDSRFRSLGAKPASGFSPRIPPREHGIDPGWERTLLLELGKEALQAAQGPSVEIGEGVRAIADLEEVLNLLAERLTNWWVNEAPSEVDRESSTAGAVARGLLAQAEGTPIRESRKEVAQLVLGLSQAIQSMEAAVQKEAEAELPNLSLLLGPMLAARLVEKAGGIERLARLPAGTVQVLGAERAFFEHLRKGNAPPKYGLLFLHPMVQGAPGAAKGRMARMIAGKAAIAARRDLAHAPALPQLKEAAEKRLASFRKRPA